MAAASRRLALPSITPRKALSVQNVQVLFELIFWDSQRNVYRGDLEVRPPRAPTTSAAKPPLRRVPCHARPTKSQFRRSHVCDLTVEGIRGVARARIGRLSWFDSYAAHHTLVIAPLADGPATRADRQRAGLHEHHKVPAAFNRDERLCRRADRIDERARETAGVVKSSAPGIHEHRNDEPLKNLRQRCTDAEERLTRSGARPAGGQATRTVPTASPILHDIPGIELSSPNERLRTDPAEATKVRGEAFDAPDPGPGPQFVMQVRE